MGDELEGKRLELLRELIPTLSQVAALTNSGNASLKKASEVLRAVAAALKIKVLVVDVRSADQLDGAFDIIVQKRADALLVPGDRVFLTNRVRIGSSRPNGACQPCLRTGNSSRRAASSPSDRATRTCTGAPPSMWTGS